MKTTYIMPAAQVIVLAGESCLLQGSPQDYSVSSYKWSDDGYLDELLYIDQK